MKVITYGCLFALLKDAPTLSAPATLLYITLWLLAPRRRQWFKAPLAYELFRSLRLSQRTGYRALAQLKRGHLIDLTVRGPHHKRETWYRLESPVENNRCPKK